MRWSRYRRVSRFRSEPTDQLRAEQQPGLGVTGDADADRLRARVVTLVIIGRGLRRGGVVAGREGFVFAEPGAGGDQVEDFHDLSAHRSGEPGCPAERVLPGNATLLVRSGPERQVGDAEEAVGGGDPVASSEDMREAGAHLLVDHDRPPRPVTEVLPFAPRIGRAERQLRIATLLEWRSPRPGRPRTSLAPRSRGVSPRNSPAHFEQWPTRLDCRFSASSSTHQTVAPRWVSLPMLSNYGNRP